MKKAQQCLLDSNPWPPACELCTLSRDHSLSEFQIRTGTFTLAMIFCRNWWREKEKLKSEEITITIPVALVHRSHTLSTRSIFVWRQKQIFATFQFTLKPIAQEQNICHTKCSFLCCWKLGPKHACFALMCLHRYFTLLLCSGAPVGGMFSDQGSR